MLQVNIELIPFGIDFHPNRRVLGTLHIGLQRVHDDNLGDYISAMTTDGKHPPANPVVRVDDHPRREGAFELIRRCFEAHLIEGDPGALSEAAAAGFLAAVESRTTESTQDVDGGPVAADAPLTCPKCGNTETASMMGIEYDYSSPNRYDGVSEWNCQLCGCRWGRWSGRILEEGDAEKPYGGA